MGALSSSSSSLVILGHIFRPPPRTPSSSLLSFFLFKQPLSNPLQTTTLRTFCASFSSRPTLLFSHSLSPSPLVSLLSSRLHSLSYFSTETQTPVEEESKYDAEFESGKEDSEPEKETVSYNSESVLNSSLLTKNKELGSQLPSLTVKEKKELASYARSLGNKLKSQQVGKSGVTDSVATALIETLEANELLKLKIHSNCPVELDDAVNQLEEATGSTVVGRIGRTVILYKPSLTKLKAEEKKKQAQRAFVKKQLAFKSSLQNKGQASRFSNRGRRGSSRV